MKTGGYEAEFGSATGGVVNVITKSGSNTHERIVLRLHAVPTASRASGSSFKASTAACRLWGHALRWRRRSGFADRQGQAVLLRRRRPARQNVTLLTRRTGFRSTASGDVDRVRNTMTYSAKVTWQVNRDHRIDASFFGDPSKGDNGPQRASALLVTDTSSFSSLNYGGHNQTVRYNGAFGEQLAGRRQLRARAEHASRKRRRSNTWRVTDQTVTPTVMTGGIGFYEEQNRSLNNQYCGQGDERARRPPAQIRRRVRQRRLQQLNQRTGPTFVAPMAGRRRPARRSRSSPTPTSGRSTESTRANFNAGTTTHAAVRQLLRAGLLADRQPADDQPRHALRAGDAQRRRSSRTSR